MDFWRSELWFDSNPTPLSVEAILLVEKYDSDKNHSFTVDGSDEENE